MPAAVDADVVAGDLIVGAVDQDAAAGERVDHQPLDLAARGRAGQLQAGRRAARPGAVEHDARRPFGRSPRMWTGCGDRRQGRGQVDRHLLAPVAAGQRVEIEHDRVEGCRGDRRVVGLGDRPAEGRSPRVSAVAGDGERREHLAALERLDLEAAAALLLAEGGPVALAEAAEP